MANTAGTVTVLEDCRVSPPPDHFLPQEILPLTYLDIIWLSWPSVSRVYFYEIPCSATEFTQTLVPQLKKSLASTLKHYYPFCGNLITPTTLSNTITTPAIRCLKGDSLSLTIAEFSGTSNSFQHLSGNHARHADELYALVPELPPKSNDTIEGDSVLISPLLSVQVTLFPDQGFSVGFRNSHVVADGKSMSNFIRTWAAINAKQLIGDVHIDNLDTLPFYDRSVINDPMGLASMIYREISRTAQENSNGFVPEDDKKDLIQVTLAVNQVQIQALKNLVPAQLQPVSTFAVVCSYVWTCMAKTRAALGQELSEVEHFIFAMDIRARLNPPIPSNYFGNAIIGGWATVQTSQITRDEGFVKAVGEIKKTIQEITNGEDGVSKGLAKLFNLVAATKGHTKFGVAGSPKFDYYSTDFGWGKPVKYEVVAEKFALSGSRDREGDLELGFCYPKSEMDVFTTIFTQGLSNY